MKKTMGRLRIFDMTEEELRKFEDEIERRWFRGGK